jgi:ABC-type amino acid transport substrate-binding protein
MKTRYSAIGLLIMLVVLMVIGVSGSGLAFQDQPTETPTATPQPPTPVPTNTPRPTWTPTEPAPTLIPPTPLPTMTPTPYEPPTMSGLAVAQTLGKLRVGTYYNEYPFTWLNEYGEVTGYEVDIIRAIGIELGVEVEFDQVTRQNAEEMLLSERVDVLIGQQVHSRDREDWLDFTPPYYVNEERMVVQTDAPYNTLQDLAGLPVAVEIGSRSERALRNWSLQTGTTFDIRTYFTESSALDALANGDVQGMVGELDSLRRAGRQQMRLIDEPVLQEPYAMVLRRFDVNMRNLLIRSMQRLKASGRLDQIFKYWFPGESIDFTELVPVYDMLYDDTRGLNDFPTDIPYPAHPVLDRLGSGQPLRVAGLVQPGQDAPAQARMLDALNRALIEEIARRWNIQVEYVPGSPLTAVDAVVNGQADIAVGISPRWDGADRVEYAQPYVRHGNRLMVPANSSITTGFGDMLGTGWWIGYFADDAHDAEDIVKFAERAGVGQNIHEPFAIQRESDAIDTMVTQNNLSAIYGDNLRLLALIRDGGYENQVKILDTPYGDDMPITFAMPRNDADFRTQINTVLQDMAQDGTYQRLWADNFGVGEPLPIPLWPAINPDVKAGG